MTTEAPTRRWSARVADRLAARRPGRRRRPRWPPRCGRRARCSAARRCSTLVRRGPRRAGRAGPLRAAAGRPGRSATSWSTARARCGSTGATGWSRAAVALPRRGGGPAARPAARRAGRAAAGRRAADGGRPAARRRRLHAVLPPVSPGRDAVACRGRRPRAFTSAELVGAGTLAAGSAGVARRGWSRPARSFLVTGGTGTGKTTLLSALLSPVDPRERVVLVEDSGELRPAHPHVVRLEARPPNVEGAGRGRPARPGAPGAADAAGPARGRRGAGRGGRRAAGRAEHRARGRLRHPARQRRRPRCRPGSRRSGLAAGLGREARCTASSPPGSTSVVHLDRVTGPGRGGWPRSAA